ncbi:MAG: cytochrome P450 [Chloroflexota bacterium]
MNIHKQRAAQFPLGASLTLAQLEADVHPILHQLRMAEPVSWVPVLDAWLVTRYDDCIAVMRDAKTYTVDHPGFSTGQVVGPSMLSLDGTQHLRHRTPFERPFRKREVETRFNASVTAQVAELIDGFVDDGQAELRRDFAGPVAVKAMITALGMDDTPVEDVLGWYDLIVDAVTRVSAGEPVSNEGRAAFAALGDSLMPALHGLPDTSQPESSLLAAAAGMADGLGDEQIISNAAVLLFGGIETTEGMIANALHYLLSDPALLQSVRANPAMIPAVVEESLRMEPAASVVDRYTTVDVELRGASIKAGDLVRVSLVGANRDPMVFDTPDVFNPQRPNLRSHVAFAQGPHVCLGLHLARLEAQDALCQALKRLPNLRLQRTEEARHAAQPQGLIFRKSPALHAIWDR